MKQKTAEDIWAGIAPVSTGCWLWLGSRSKWGYGHTSLWGRRWRVHRLTYELLIGPIPKGLGLNHLCEIRHCVNPTHLQPMTTRENLMYSDTPARRNLLKTHCPQGHPYNEANTRIMPTRRPGRVRRQCRECCRLRMAEIRRLQRAA